MFLEKGIRCCANFDLGCTTTDFVFIKQLQGLRHPETCKVDFKAIYCAVILLANSAPLLLIASYSIAWDIIHRTVKRVCQDSWSHQKSGRIQVLSSLEHMKGLRTWTDDVHTALPTHIHAIPTSSSLIQSPISQLALQAYLLIFRLVDDTRKRKSRSSGRLCDLTPFFFHALQAGWCPSHLL